MDHSSTVIIDIGGTRTKVFSYVGSSEERALANSFHIPTPSTTEDLFRALKRIKGSHRCHEYIIGLPGPVNSAAEEIYCPPLDYAISTREICDIFCECDVIAMNDTVPFLISASCKYKQSELSIYTIGTSLGHSFLRQVGNNKNLLLSLESAHSEIGSRFRSWQERKMPVALEAQRKMKYMNYDFLSQAILLSNEQGKSARRDLLEAIADEIVSCERLMPGSEIICLEGGFGKWLAGISDMSIELSTIIEDSLNCKAQVIVGSLDFKQFKSNVFIREHFVCPGMVMFRE